MKETTGYISFSFYCDHDPDRTPDWEMEQLSNALHNAAQKAGFTLDIHDGDAWVDE